MKKTKDTIDRQLAIEAIEKAVREDPFRSETGLLHVSTVIKILSSLPPSAQETEKTSEEKGENA